MFLKVHKSIKIMLEYYHIQFCVNCPSSLKIMRFLKLCHFLRPPNICHSHIVTLVNSKYWNVMAFSFLHFD